MAVLSVTGFPAALCPKKKRGPVYAWANAKINIPFGGYVNNKGKYLVPYVRPGVIVALLLLLITFIMLRHTKLGRSFYAIGGNAVSAAMMGLNDKMIRMRA